MGVLVCVDIGMRKGEGGICWTFSGECGGELEGVVVGICVGVGRGGYACARGTRELGPELDNSWSHSVG